MRHQHDKTRVSGLAEIPIIIVVPDLGKLHQVRAACERLGVAEIQEIEKLGMLRGLVDPARLPDLQTIPGVGSVEQERGIQLPPKKSPIQ